MTISKVKSGSNFNDFGSIMQLQSSKIDNGTENRPFLAKLTSVFWSFWVSKKSFSGLFKVVQELFMEFLSIVFRNLYSFPTHSRLSPLGSRGCPTLRKIRRILIQVLTRCLFQKPRGKFYRYLPGIEEVFRGNYQVFESKYLVNTF